MLWRSAHPRPDLVISDETARRPVDLRRHPHARVTLSGSTEDTLTTLRDRLAGGLGRATPFAAAEPHRDNVA